MLDPSEDTKTQTLLEASTGASPGLLADWSHSPRSHGETMFQTERGEGWRDGSVGEALAVKACRLEFKPPESM